MPCEGGKSAALRIGVDVAQIGDDIEIRVRDDGKGVDWDGVRQRAVDRGFVLAPEAASLTESDLCELLFAAGMSTRDHIDASAGRGLGLDIVQQVTRQFGGQVHMTSERGRFTEFCLRIPRSSLVRDSVRAGSARRSA